MGMGQCHYGRAAELLEQVVEIGGRTSASDNPYLLQSQQLLEIVYRHIEAEENAEWMSTFEEETLPSICSEKAATESGEDVSTL